MDYGLDGRGSIPRQGQHFSILHSLHIGSGFHSASYPNGTGGCFSGIKRPGREADYSPPSSAEVKNYGAIYLHSPMRLHGVVLN
jgi:hypothetical protein